MTFRVWAPNASRVWVKGDFNGWSLSANPLTVESGNGCWSADIAGAQADQAYNYVVTNAAVAVAVSRRDPQGRAVSSSGSNSLILAAQSFDWTGDGFVMPTNTSLVMYEMHVGTYYDPAPSNDMPATFLDATNKLDYLRDLGINCVALMPVAEFYGNHSWGYNPSDPFAVERAYGGATAFKTFIKACHQRGMAVQLDVVHNHYGESGTNDPSGKLDLWRFDGYYASGQPAVNQGGIYFYPESGKSRTVWGPRPCYTNAGVRNFIKDNVRMWLDEYRISGFRWDSPKNILGYNPQGYGEPTVALAEGRTLLEEIHSFIATNYTDRYSVAEDANVLGNFGGHWQVGFHKAIEDQLLGRANTNDTRTPMRIIMDTLRQVELPGFRVIFTDNHDKSGDLNQASEGYRLAQDLDPGNPTSYVARKKTGLAAVLTLTAPGTPMIFMGQEMLAAGNFSAEGPMDWMRANSQYPTVLLHRDLIRLRRNLDGNTGGLLGVDPTNTCAEVGRDENSQLLAYHRYTLGGGVSNDVVVVINFTNQTRTGYSITFPRPGPWYVHFNSDWPAYSPDFANIGPTNGQVTTGVGNVGTLTIAPYSALILSRVPPPARDPNGDADHDGMPDAWEMLNQVDDPLADPDGDNLGNREEFQRGWDPHTPNRQTIAGTFNDWDASEANMRYFASNIWEYISPFPVPCGTVAFKYYVSGQWYGNQSSNILFNISTAGVYRFTFNDQSLQYQAVRLPAADSDLDGMHDAWERFYGVTDPLADPDLDGFSNSQEFQRASTPCRFDFPNMTIVGDNLPDGWLLTANNMRYVGLNRWLYLYYFQRACTLRFKFLTGGNWDLGNNWGDNNSDGIGDRWGADIYRNITTAGYYVISFNENNWAYAVSAMDATPDADLDAMPDTWEQFYGLNPLVQDGHLDADSDGVPNRGEYTRHSNPRTNDHYSTMNVVGDLNGWNLASANMRWASNSMVWYCATNFAAGYTFRYKYNTGSNWDINWGDSNGDGYGERWGSDITGRIVTAGAYMFAFDEISGKYSLRKLSTYDAIMARQYGLYDRDAQPTDDWDRDGWVNGLEYALGGNPVGTDPTNILPLPSQTTGKLFAVTFVFRTNDTALSFRIRKTDQILTIPWATNGISAATGIDQSGVPVGCKRVRYQSTLPMTSAGQQFLGCDFSLRYE